MPDKPTHRVVESPKVHGRYLSDYMNSSERARRTIIRGCKYPPIAKLLQHHIAKSFITAFLKKDDRQKDDLTGEAERLRNMMADSPFDRDLFDNNADFLNAYAEVFSADQLPSAEISPIPDAFKVNLNGVDVNPDLRLGLQRTMNNNRVRTGLLTIRYAKGKALPTETGLWQSSLLFGCRKMLDVEDESAAEKKLCVTLDAFTGELIAAPGDALSRFKNMEAACQSIAERWDSVEPPPNAVLK